LHELPPAAPTAAFREVPDFRQVDAPIAVHA